MVKIQVRSGLFTTASRTRMRSGDQFSVCIEFLPFGLKKKEKKWGWQTVSENSRVVFTPISINFVGSQELGLQGNPPTVYQRSDALLNVCMVKIICCGGEAISGGHSSHSRAVPTLVGSSTVVSSNLKKNITLNCVPNVTSSSKQKQ